MNTSYIKKLDNYFYPNKLKKNIIKKIGISDYLRLYLPKLSYYNQRYLGYYFDLAFDALKDDFINFFKTSDNVKLIPTDALKQLLNHNKQEKYKDCYTLEVIKYIIGNSEFRHVDFKYFYNVNKEKIEEFLLDEINNNNHMTYLHYYVNPLIQSFVMDNLTMNQIIHIYTNLFYSVGKEELLRGRYNEMASAIMDEFGDSPTKILDVLYSIKNNEVTNNQLFKDYFTFDIINNMLDDISNASLLVLSSINPSLVYDVFMDRRKNKKLYSNGYFCYYPEEIILMLTNDLSDEELLDVLNNPCLTPKVADLIYKNYNDRVSVIFFENIYNDKRALKNLLSNSKGSILYNELLYSLPIEEIIGLDILTLKEKDAFFKNKEREVKGYILEEYNRDKIDLFKREMGYYSDPGDSYKSPLHEYILSLYTLEDYYDLVMANSDNKVISVIDNTNIIYRNVEEIVRKYSQALADKDYDLFVTFLKGVRINFSGSSNNSNDLFKLALDITELDNSVIEKLFVDNRLSLKQKDIIFNKYRLVLLDSINTKLKGNEEVALTYIQRSTPKDILSIALENISKDRLINLLNDKEFVNQDHIGEKFAIKLIKEIYINKELSPIVERYLKIYTKDKCKFIYNFETIINFLNELGIFYEDFFESSLNLNYDYIDDMVYIYNNSLNPFKVFKSYYLNNINSKENLVNIIKNYVRYEKLCLSLLKEELTEEDVNKLLILFKREETLEEIPSNINECNIDKLIRNNLINLYNESKTIDDFKNVILLGIFDSTLENTKDKLDNYGNTTSLLELKYYNNNNEEVNKMIDDIIYYTSMMEDIINSNDIDSLKEVASNVINNIDMILSDYNFSDYDELMRKLYCKEMDSNLTKIDNDSSKDAVLDKTSSKRYGVDVYNFYDKEYSLLAHVMSDREDIDDLMNGRANGSMAFISYSAISHRNQSYYWGSNKLIFGYDSMPSENYICSSKDNMGSNGAIKRNSTEVEEVSRKQRGLLEISDTTGNSEVLCYRENMKPKYIIVPGREPNSDEINVAKKYNLIICKTQKKESMISSPKKIPNDKELKRLKLYRSELLQNVKNDLITHENDTRKIAIITDIHGLLEPTITVLEDIRKSGITEIYSLGDNIGTGPNPSEVIDLLNMYGVKSIKGNHELYLTNLDDYMDHLRSTGAVDEATLNSAWNNLSLRSDQKAIIKEYPDHIDLIVGNKKILLCHYLNDYNTGKKLFNTEDYDYVIQGHVHFEDKEDNVITLKALGIGNSSRDDVGRCNYCILTEKEDGFDIENKTIVYDYKNTLDNINKSDINTKDKMSRWIRNG